MSGIFFALQTATTQGPTFADWRLIGSSLLMFLLLIVLAAVARSEMKVVPKGWSAAFEHVFDWIDEMACDMMGPSGRAHVPFITTIFLFVLVSNWSDLLPLPGFILQHHAKPTDLYLSPTASYNTTLALTMISFFAFNFYGLKKHLSSRRAEQAEAHEGHQESPGVLVGLGHWIAHFWHPIPELWSSAEGPFAKVAVAAMCPMFIGLNIVEELARILSLSMRLYGNIFGGHEVNAHFLSTMAAFAERAFTDLGKAQVLGFVGSGLLAGTLWVSSLLAVYVGALDGFIQALIFALLTLVYIALAVADDH